MTKGELNIAVAELQQKVDRIKAMHAKALKTAAAAVDRKYSRQLQELLDQQDIVYKGEVVPRVDFPDFWNEVEDLDDSEVARLPDLDGDPS